VKRNQPRGWTAFRRSLARYAYLFALVMAAVAAMFGIPIIIDPPPGDRVEESQDAEGKIRRRKKRSRAR
jgi:hypothetical protein